MADKLTELYEAWRATQPDPAPAQEGFPAFQGGFTASAVSMRNRAISIVQSAKLPDQVKNNLLTAIGTLSDIPG